MSSVRQIEANRANARLSTGATSPEGKAKKSHNLSVQEARLRRLYEKDEVELKRLTRSARKPKTTANAPITCAGMMRSNITKPLNNTAYNSTPRSGDRIFLITLALRTVPRPPGPPQSYCFGCGGKADNRNPSASWGR